MKKSEDRKSNIAGKKSDKFSICPDVELPVEIYTPERVAEFLLNNAIDAEDYENARAEVMKMGIDPDSI